MFKASWVYCIIKALESRLQWIQDERDVPALEMEEEKDLQEALDYFRSLELEAAK